MHAESVDEVLPESHKLCGYIALIVHGDVSGGKSSADWLIDIDHVGQVGPRIWVMNRSICSRLP